MSTSGLPTIADLEAAIMREENVNPAYNNPFAITNPQTGKINTYSTLQEGTQAGQNLIQNAITGVSPSYGGVNQSLEDFENTYTGGDPNAAQNLSSMLGVPTSTPMGAFLAGSTMANGSQPASSSSTPNTSSTASGTSTGFTPPSWWQYVPGLDAIYDMYKPGATKTPAITFHQLVINTVAVIAGIVLIAGAVFGFRTVTETVTNTIKKGAETAAV